MDEQTKSRDQFAEWTVGEILKAKARWIQMCLSVILPPDLYEKAKVSEELGGIRTYCRSQGYVWKEYSGPLGGESRLYKGPIIVSLFRPVLVGEREERHMEFYVEINGRQVDLDGHIVTLH